MHALTKYQLGHTRTLANGAIVVDGQPASPRMPDELRHLAPPPVGSPKADIDAYQQAVAHRRLDLLHAVGGRADDGYEPVK